MADAVFNSCNSFQPVGRKITLLEARVNFGGLQQHLDQTVEDFAAVLRAAAVDCRFGAYLDEHLRDRFVFGLIPGPIHDLLLQEDFNITFSDAVKKASDLERLWSRPLLVPDWLTPQSIFSSDPLEDDNSASQPQLSDTTLASLYSEPLHSGPPSFMIGPQLPSSSTSVALVTTLHSEPRLLPVYGEISVPTESTKSAPFEQIVGRTPDPDLADLQLISEEHLANARTKTSHSGLDRWTPDPTPTDLHVVEQHCANALTETFRSHLDRSTTDQASTDLVVGEEYLAYARRRTSDLPSTNLQVISEEPLAAARTETFRSQLDFVAQTFRTPVSGALQDQRGSSCAFTSSSFRSNVGPFRLLLRRFRIHVVGLAGTTS